MREGIVFATMLIMYFLFMFLLFSYINQLEDNLLKSLVIITYLLVGIFVLGYAGK